MPRAAVVRTIEAIRDSKIIIAENNPNVLNNPIEEVAITQNPAISETAEPINTRAQAPPTPRSAITWSAPFSFSSLYRSVTCIQ